MSGSVDFNDGWAEGRKALADELREAISDLHLHVFPEEGIERLVRDRNLVAKPMQFDALMLDDVWQVLDDVTSSREHPHG